MNYIAQLFMVAACFYSAAQPLQAQPFGPPREALREMEKLRFLTGRWEGTGWVEHAPGQRQNIRSGEEVQFKLDGVVLLIEGIHHMRVPGQSSDMKIHHALATVTYDESAKDYRFRALKSDNQSVDARGQLARGAFVWGFTDPRMGQLRFTIRLTRDGRWEEIGERSADGKTWVQFFEMTLAKRK
jgi:hypothetical protein